MLKKLVSLLLVVALLSISTFSFVFAADNKNDIKKEGVITITDSDYDTMIKTGKPVYLGDNTWAKIVTFDEMVSEVAKNKGISASEERSQIMSSKVNDKNLSTNVNNDIFYVHFYKQFEVGNTGWYPQLDIYVKCQGPYRDFIGISDLNLIRSYNYVSKQFSGKCQAKIESVKRIYWVVNGDFYDYGATSWSFGGSVGIGQYATLTFSISRANNYFGYAYNYGYIDNR
ncbi:hypothetical protein CE561_00140 [Thermoanaerobacterium thermosaccharolyticum]|uniref:Uncharacterized protein n=1 Tax=Thermoanaerobacterium thermosaccharolyticum TaxID=1517 RepID=A0A231VNN5_THETR|nr:hypothetical protein [Thermoanaerobacterium thermosaccharolyticum]OXT09581.1 hypothetical protein CE561_00140 [Thermoanaerobacterium thermosaccharolyticum]